MNKRGFFVATVILWSILFMNSTKANAQLFGADEENWNKIFNELKKMNARLIAIEASESGILGSHLEEVQRQIKEIKQAIPQSSIGEVINQINAQNKRLEDTNYIFKSELIPAIQKDMKGLKEGLAKDMETFAIKNQELNQKLIEILEVNLKQGVANKSLLDSIKEDLEHVGEFNRLSDEKFNKLLELSTELAVHSVELEKSVVGQLKKSAKEQQEIKRLLAELRRKANVNISRNDDIKKTLKKSQNSK
jgi:hypothetical protein